MGYYRGTTQIKIGNKTIDLNKVYSNPFATAFKSQEQIDAETKLEEETKNNKK